MKNSHNIQYTQNRAKKYVSSINSNDAKSLVFLLERKKEKKMKQNELMEQEMFFQKSELVLKAVTPMLLVFVIGGMLKGWF